MEKLQSPQGCGEQVLASERLHRAIFILPILSIVLFLVPMVMLIAVVQKLFSVIGTLPGGTTARSQWIFLIPFSIGIVPGLLGLLFAWAAYSRSLITLTKKRLAFSTGFLSKTSGEFPLENIEAIFLQEPFLGRWLGYGTVMVTTLGGSSFPLRYLHFPQQFHSKLQHAVAAAKIPAKFSAEQSVVNPHSSTDDSR